MTKVKELKLLLYENTLISVRNLNLDIDSDRMS